MKICRRCKKNKPQKDFYSRKEEKDGLNTYCRTCSRLKSKENNIRNSEKIKRKTRDYCRKNKEKIKAKRKEREKDPLVKKSIKEYTSNYCKKKIQRNKY